LVLAITVASLYGIDLAYATNNQLLADSRWIYAEVVAGLSAIACIFHCLFFLKPLWLLWDCVLFVLWAVLFGVFGTVFLGGADMGEDAGMTSVSRM